MSELTKLSSINDAKESRTPTGLRRDPDVIDVFTIPDEMAKELSELLGRNAVKKEQLPILFAQNPAKYEEMEGMLVADQARAEALQMRITADYVPDKYRSEEYTWRYTTYDISGNEVWIKKSK